MTTRISATAKDKLSELQVTRQTSLVVTDVKSELELFNIDSIIERIRNNPVEILEIIERLKQNRIKTTLGLLSNLRDMLSGDIDALRFEALRKLTDRLSNVLKDRALLAGLTEEQYSELLMLMQLAQDKMRNNKINYSYNGNTYNNAYNPNLQDTAQRFVDTIAALNPTAEIESIDVIGTEAVYTKLIEDAITLGANDVALEYIATIPDPVSRASIINDSFNNAIALGNINYIEKLLDFSHTSIPALVAAVPDWKIRILSTYSFPLGTTGKDYAALLTQLLDILTQLNQGQNGEWYYYTRFVDEVDSDTGELTGEVIPTSVYDLALFVNLSKDAETLLMNSSVLRVPVMQRNFYKPTDYLTLHRSTYPYSIA